MTKVRYIPDLSALVTSSLDCTINMCDPEKIGSYERFRHSFHTFRAHTKGVYSFDWSRQNSFIASCGLERNAYGILMDTRETDRRCFVVYFLDLPFLLSRHFAASCGTRTAA